MSMPIRVGQGFDVHVLCEGRPLILGGVTIPHTHGLMGHSDADALLHAITDAILGRRVWEILGVTFRTRTQNTRVPIVECCCAMLMSRYVRLAGW